MLPIPSSRRRPGTTGTRIRARLAGSLGVGLALTLAGTVLSAPAYAANPVTPGNFRGLGFDQCEAPSQTAMSTWIRKSPFRAAGIYISGASRGCKRQRKGANRPRLTAPRLTRRLWSASCDLPAWR